MAVQYSEAGNASSGASANSIGALRYLLAVLIVLHHTNGITGSDLPLLLRADTVVYVFFALSGFFAWQSYGRSTSSWCFIRHRMLRLLPAYWVVVLFSAVGLSAFSELPLSDYFTSAGFWKYLCANSVLLNFLQPELPGVFGDHLISAVNGSLWYVKLEVAFTFLVPLVGKGMDLLSRLSEQCVPQTWRNRAAVSRYCSVLFWLALSSAVFSVRFLCGEGQLFRYLCDMLMFLSGLIVSQLWHTRKSGFAFSRICFFCLIILGIFVWARDTMLHPYLYFLLSMVVVWSLIFCFMSTGFAAFFNRNNMSYSLYLCHFPLIQSAISLTSTQEAAFALSAVLLLSGTWLLHHGVARLMVLSRS